MDAKVNYPIKDINGKTCAIIKVESGAERGLTFDTGTISITEVVQKPGQIWLYVSPGIRKLNIYHNDYKACYYDLPLSITEGYVYSLDLRLFGGKSRGTFIETVTVTSGYLKIRTTPAQAVVSLGKTKAYELDRQMTSADGSYSKMLEYGEYFYKVESDYCETYEGRVLFGESTPRLDVSLASAFNHIIIRSHPESDANVVIAGLDSRDDGEGKTPFAPEEKFNKGRYKVTLMYPEYAYFEQIITLDGDGTTKEFDFRMTPQFAQVTCVCESPQAEIWIDDEYKGIGSWTGRVSGSIQHKLESRLPNHHSQSRAFTLENGEVQTISIGAPLPKYALLDVTSTPAFCTITVNGENFGETPVLKKIPLGSCVIFAMADGHESGDTRLELTEEGKTYSVNIVLEPKKSQVRAENKRKEPQRQDPPVEKKPVNKEPVKKEPVKKNPVKKEPLPSRVRFQQDVALGSGWMGQPESSLWVSAIPAFLEYIAGVRMSRFFIGAGVGLNLDVMKFGYTDVSTEPPGPSVTVADNLFAVDLEACARFYFLKEGSKVNPYLSANFIYGLGKNKSFEQNTSAYSVTGYFMNAGGIMWSACFGLDFMLAKSCGLALNLGLRQFNAEYVYCVEDLSTHLTNQGKISSIIFVPMASIALTF